MQTNTNTHTYIHTQTDTNAFTANTTSETAKRYTRIIKITLMYSYNYCS